MGYSNTPDTYWKISESNKRSGYYCISVLHQGKTFYWQNNLSMGGLLFLMSGDPDIWESFFIEKIGGLFTLKSLANNSYCCADTFVLCNRNQADSWEHFSIEPI